MTEGQHPNPSPAEPDWASLLRSELDAHSPRRLPARFTPRQGGVERSWRARRGLWRPLAVALAVILVAAGLVTATAYPGGLVGALHRVTGIHSNPSPGTKPSASPSVSTGPAGSAGGSGGAAPGAARSGGGSSPAPPGANPAPVPGNPPPSAAPGGAGGAGGAAGAGGAGGAGSNPPAVPLPSLPVALPPLPVQTPPLPKPSLPVPTPSLPLP
jgi:hypothetical protein